MPSTDLPVVVDVIPIGNEQWTGDVQALAALIAKHLTGIQHQSSGPNGPILGQTGGGEPQGDQGLWLNNNVWYNWSPEAARYLPFPLVAGGLSDGTLRSTKLIPTNTGPDITLYLPSQDGATLATLDDLLKLSSLNPTKTLTDPSTLALDLDATSKFWINLQGNLTLTFTGGTDGQIIDVWFITPASTVSPLVITWSGFYAVGSGALSSTDSSHLSVTNARISIVGDRAFVEYGTTWTIEVVADRVLPEIVSINVNVGSTTVTVNISKLLTAGSLDATKFYLSKDGSKNTVISAIADGKIITLTVANPYTSTSNGSLAYNGTDIIDVSGNKMSSFQPIPLNVIQPASGVITL